MRTCPFQREIGVPAKRSHLAIAPILGWVSEPADLDHELDCAGRTAAREGSLGSRLGKWLSGHRSG